MYAVEWTQTAYDDLARVWTAADAAGRAAITRAVPALEARLTNNPLAEGESRGRLTRRYIHEAPVGLDVDVSEAANVVKVLRVWAY